MPKQLVSYNYSNDANTNSSNKQKYNFYHKYQRKQVHLSIKKYGEDKYIGTGTARVVTT